MFKDFLKNLFKPKAQFNQNGWLTDPADPRDYRHEEIASAPVGIVWASKPQAQWRRFEPIRNQNGAGACVAFATALCVGILNFLREGKFAVLSPRFIYGRGYQPQSGMYYKDGLLLAIKNGLPLEQQMPSDGKSEADMRLLTDEKDSDRLTAQVFKGKDLIMLPIDFDTIASVIDTGIPVLLGVRFADGGFATFVVKLTAGAINGHAIVGVDRTWWENQKALVFQNSWTRDGWGYQGLGVITEDQKAGIQFAGYITALDRAPQTSTAKPKLHIEATQLKVGQVNNADVVKLQTMLQWLGYFPAGQVCTGNFYGITRQAVRDYQKAKGLPVLEYADQNTIAALNNDFV